MKVTLYTIHCPNCKVLEKKLAEKPIEVEMIDGEDEVVEAAKKYGVKSAPFIVVDESVMAFPEAIKWVREQ